jgi:hypothetical protein
MWRRRQSLPCSARGLLLAMALYAGLLPSIEVSTTLEFHSKVRSTAALCCSPRRRALGRCRRPHVPATHDGIDRPTDRSRSIDRSMHICVYTLLAINFLSLSLSLSLSHAHLCDLCLGTGMPDPELRGGARQLLLDGREQLGTFWSAHAAPESDLPPQASDHYSPPPPYTQTHIRTPNHHRDSTCCRASCPCPPRRPRRSRHSRATASSPPLPRTQLRCPHGTPTPSRSTCSSSTGGSTRW